MARWHWVVRIIKCTCSYLAQMQHFGNMEQVCGGVKSHSVSEIFFQVVIKESSTSEPYETKLLTWCCKWNKWTDTRFRHLTQSKALFLTSDFRTLPLSSCRAIFSDCLWCRKCSKQTPLYGSWLCSYQEPPSHECFGSTKRLRHHRLLLEIHTCLTVCCLLIQLLAREARHFVI